MDIKTHFEIVYDNEKKLIELSKWCVNTYQLELAKLFLDISNNIRLAILFLEDEVISLKEGKPMNREKVRNSFEQINANIQRLQQKSIAFASTGNDKMARILMNIAEDITVSCEHIRKEIDNDLNQH